MQNTLPFAVNLSPGGGLLQLSPAAAGAPVQPNATVTYVWAVPASAGPGPSDFSTIAYTYRSSVDLTAHENAGLVGAIVVSRAVCRCSERPFPQQIVKFMGCLDLATFLLRGLLQ